MAKTNWTSVDAYIAAQPLASRTVLTQVRQAIRKALPDAAEVYPATAGVVGALAGALSRYGVSKGTIRFPLAGRVPVGLVARIARLRAREVAERALARRVRQRRRTTGGGRKVPRRAVT